MIQNRLPAIEKKTLLKFGLLLLALLIGLTSLIYTHSLVRKLTLREQRLIDLYAKGLEAAITSDHSGNLTFLFQEIIEANNSIPVILTDEKGQPISYKNIDFKEGIDEKERTKQLINELEKCV